MADKSTLSFDALENEDSVRVNGVPPHGWDFRTLAISVAGESYEIVAARRGGNNPFTMRPIDLQDVEQVRAEVFLGEALRLLS